MVKQDMSVCPRYPDKCFICTENHICDSYKKLIEVKQDGWVDAYIQIDKGIYDTLMKKADKWDRYLNSIKDSIPHVSLDDYEVLEDKLEAIKKWYEKWNIKHLSTIKQHREFQEILEGKG